MPADIENIRPGLDIAVIGMAGRFPGAGNIDEFWNNLKNGVESIAFFSDEELRQAGISQQVLEHPGYVRANSVLEDIEYFDASFFGYSPREAEKMDPQIRIMHECTWEALEDAGYDPYEYPGVIGFFVGANNNVTWQLKVFMSGVVGSADRLTSMHLCDRDHISTRIAYKLNLTGPVFTLESQCSTSLVSIHQAIQALLSGECDMALAGGVSVILPQKNGHVYEEGMIFTADGHTRAFDSRASGSKFGSGAGIVVLKPIEEALEKRDNIIAVVKSSFINNDGNRKIGYSAPSVNGLEEVIKTALELADVEPESISCIEAHGTATPLGDQIEMEALRLAFNTDKRHFCRIGSVKTNVGHLDNAAGVASFIKTLLALKYRLIPPSLHFENPDPAIDFDHSAFIVNTQLHEWENRDYPLRAGVSSFGIGGTNAHMILEEAPKPTESPQTREWQLMLLSARTESALQMAAQNLTAYLREHPAVNLADMCYTLQVGRRVFPYRLAITTANNADGAAAALSGDNAAFLNTHHSRRLYFLFSDPAETYVNMGLALYRHESTFKEEVDHCLMLLQPLAQPDFKRILYPQANEEAKAGIEIKRPEIGPVIRFIYGYALAKLLMKWGLKPYGLIGCNAGEITAACISGVFSLEDALTWLVYSVQSIQTLPEDQRLSIALARECEDKIKSFNLQSPRISLISPKTGKVIKDADVTSSRYWLKHLLETVKPGQGVRALTGKKGSLFVEIGCEGELGSLVSGCLEDDSDQYVMNLARPAQEETADVKYLLRQLGRLWLYGVPIDWPGFYGDEKRRRISLPPYPFERQSYWIDDVDARIKNSFDRRAGQQSVKKQPDIADWFSLLQWERSQLAPGQAIGIPERSCCLVFTNGSAFCQELVKRLRRERGHVVTVAKGSDFLKQDKHGYTIDPRQPGHYDALLNELRAINSIPVTIVHLWGVGGSPSGDEAQDLGLFSLLYLAQAVGKQQFKDEINIYILSSGIHEVNGEEELYPGRATVLGLARCIPQEFVNIKCRCIDIVAPKSLSRAGEKLIDSLLEEFSTKSPDNVVAYRGYYRWAEAYRPIRLEPVDGDIPRLRERGVYFITGGLGNVGFILARYLAASFRARLVLTGRTELPPRSEWGTYSAAHGNNDRLARKIEKVLALEKAGGEVMTFAVDAADKEEMQKTVADAERHFGVINGIIHAAGVMDPAGFRTINSLTKNDIQVQFQAKVYGLLVLQEIFKNRPLDFCLLISSPASILGGLGFSAYSAANMFMDAFVYRFNRDNCTAWTVVNWGDWQPGDDSRVNTSALGESVEELLMTAAEGVETLRRILKHGRTNQVIISAGALQKRIAEWVQLESTRKDDDSRERGHRALKPRPELSTPYVAPGNPVEKTLVTIWEHLFGFARLGIKDDFFEVGGDSLKVVTVIARIHKKLNVVIPLTEFFKRPTIEKIVEYIDSAEISDFVAINPVEKREYYPVSSAQKRLYFLQIMDKNSLGYNEFQVVALDGELERNRLEKALSQLIRRHESLRTGMTMIGSDLCQRIHGEVEFAVNYYKAEADGVKPIVERFVQPFDLSRPPFMRVGVIQTGEKKYVFMIDMHHIITDGVSSELFIKEFTALYANRELAPLRVQYKDYTRWQQMQRTQGSLKEQEEYWLAEFTGELPVLELPTDFPRPPLQSFLGNTVGFELGINETKRLKELALENDLTLFMLLVPAFTLLLAKLSGQTDIIVGTPTAGRRHEDLQSIIGVFINTLVIRSQPVGGKTIAQYLGEIKDITLKAFENQDYQFEDLIERVAVNRDMSRNPLFDVMFILQNMDVQPEGLPEAKISDLEARPYARPGKISKFDLTLIAVESHDNLYLTFEYCTKLFNIDSIGRMIKYLRAILASVRQGWDSKIGEIEILTDEERTQILYTFNNTAAPYPQEQTVHGLFESRVNGSLLQPALVYQECRLSFEACNDQANRLAAELRDRGVGANSIVALMVERSVEMMLAILGILKAGGAYLPIDPDFPEERVKYMLKDSQAALLVTQERFSATFGDMCHCLNLDDFPLDGSESVTIEPVNRAADLVYVTYTSGSTGNPKGVMIQHRAVVNFIKAMTGLIEFSQKDCALSLTTISFDIFGLETLVPLTAGTAVVIGSREEQLNSRAAALAVESKRVTILQVTPSKLQLIVSSPEAKRILTPLKYLLVGGELFPQPLLEEARKIVQGKIFNLYGPTETTIWSTARDVTGKDVQLNIGKPIANTTTYVLDNNGFPTPIGVAGELYIGGAGLSRGYLNRPDLTAGQFSPNQHLSPGSPRLYRSGDLVRWLPDGELEILGRIDHQVKVRGFRIEPGEIESQLLKRGDIKDALVTVKSDNKREKSIFAYIIPTNGSDDFDAAELREYLSLKLPEYMIPSYFIRLEALPLMANGKVDHKALESDGMMIGTEVEYTPPETELEMTLTEIWREVLRVDKVGVHDNFFDLGGNSMGVISLNTKIKEVLNLDIPVVVVYRYLTVSSLAKYLMQGDSGMDHFARKTDRTEEFRRGKDRIKQRIKRRYTDHEQIN